MESFYIYKVVFDCIFLIVCFMMKRNRKYHCNFEILWLFFEIANEAGNKDVAAIQISYYAGALSILTALYFVSLEVNKQIIEKKATREIDKEVVQKAQGE